MIVKHEITASLYCSLHSKAVQHSGKMESKTCRPLEVAFSPLVNITQIDCAILLQLAIARPTFHQALKSHSHRDEAGAYTGMARILLEGGLSKTTSKSALDYYKFYY